jgi:hypothetical protein
MAVLLPSIVVTVIFAVPTAIPLTTPEGDTVATLILSDDHEMAVLVASDGKTVAVSAEL